MKEDGSEPHERVHKYNLPRRVIKEYFNKRNCFSLPRPTNEEEDLQNLQSIATCDLRDKFVKAADDMYCNVLQEARPYKLNGINLTGTSKCT